MTTLLLESDDAIRDLLSRTQTIAVLGMKTEAQSGQPSFEVPRYLVEAGYEVIPVPVYYPEVTRILGRDVFRRLADVPRRIDIVDVFRKSSDLEGHLDDILAAAPRSVWLQSGIRDDGFARRLTDAGIAVVQDRCLMVDHRRLAGRRPEARDR